MSIIKLRQDTIKQLISNNVNPYDASVEADLLIEKFFDISKIDYIINNNLEISTDKLNTFYKNLDKRINDRIPVQYILGYTYFYGLKIFVNEDVLIPRRDTELLVSIIVDKFKDKHNAVIADIGVGSGNISIAILKNTSINGIIATDTSKNAIKIAKKNAEFHKVSNMINFYNTNILEGLNTELDAIVSNPPYIVKNEMHTIAPEVINHEPHSALFVNNVLDYYSHISFFGNKLLKSSGLLAVEIPYNHSDTIKSFFSKSGWFNITVHKDMNNLPRVISAEKI